MQRRPVSATPGPTSRSEPRLVGALDPRDEPADADPHGREDRGEQEQDHRPVVPGPVPSCPEGVVRHAEDEDDHGWEDPRERFA